MSFVALSNNTTSSTLPFLSSSTNSSKMNIYRRDMYPSVLEEIVFRSISEKLEQKDPASLRSKREISVNSRTKERKCLSILRKIKNAREFADFQPKNVSCDFSNKDSSASKLANETYENIKNHLDFQGELELNRFLFLSRFIFHSEGFISSDLVIKYLARLNQIAKLLWKHPPISESEKSRIKTILSEHFKYKLVEKCKEDEREAIHSQWKQCMIDVSTAFSSLYHTIEECRNFAIDYVNNFRELLSITPQEKKESIGNMIWGPLEEFISRKKEPDGSEPNRNAQNALREQLQIQNITGVSDLINQISTTTTQASTSADVSIVFSAQNTTTEDVINTFTASMNDEVSITTDQSTTEAVSSAFSAEDEIDDDIITDQSSTSNEDLSAASPNTTIEDVITNIFTASMNQTRVTDEASTIQPTSTVEDIDSIFSAEGIITDQSSTSNEDLSTASLTQSTITEDVTNIFATSMNQPREVDEVSTTTTQTTSTMEAASPAFSTTDKTTAVTRSTDQSEDLSTISTEDTPTENVTIASTSIIATSIGIISALSAFIGYIFFRKKKSENDNCSAKSYTNESTV